MRASGFPLLLWLIVALLLLLVWLTVSGRLGDSRHGYVAAAVPPDASSPPSTRS